MAVTQTIASSAAYVIGRISELWGELPDTTALQRIVYLVQQKGVDLGYQYGVHFAGPYSAALDVHTLFLSAEGLIRFSSDGTHHFIGLTIRGLAANAEGLSPEDLAVIDEAIAYCRGRSPEELELLTTALFVHDHLQDGSEAKVAAGVRRLTGARYSREEIDAAIREFAFFGRFIQAA